MGTPTVTPLVEQWHDGGFIVSEANGHISRETGTIAGGVKLYPGTVLGQNTTDLTYHQLTEGATDGTQNAAGVLFAYKDVTAANKKGVVMVRSCELNASELIWPAGITAPQIAAATAQLAAASVILR